MNDSMIEQGPKSIEHVPSADAISASADITASKSFRNLIPKKAGHIAEIVKRSLARATLTAPVLSLIISSGCGNTETQPQITPEPTPISTTNIATTPKIELPISTSTIPVSEPTRTPSPRPTPYPIESPDLIFTPKSPAATPTRTPTSEPTSTPKPTPTKAPTPEPTQTITTTELSEKDLTIKLIEEMKLKYGIDMKVSISSFYDITDPSGFLLKEYNIGPKPSRSLKASEITVLREALGTLPFCSQFTDQITIVKQPSKKNPQADFDYMGGTHVPKSHKEGKSYLTLLIAENADLKASTKDYKKLGIETFGDLLKQIFFHECGHVASDMIVRAAYSDDEYFKIRDDMNSGKDYGVRDKKNPLLRVFAKLEGWELNQKAFKEGHSPTEQVYTKSTSTYDNRMVYQATQIQIEEHFAELFGLYVSNSPTLTPEEKKFFKKIYDGLKADPQEFAKKVARDPLSLLDN